VPAWLQEVILRCIEPRPRDRYASAAQVAFDLEHPGEVAVSERGQRTRRSGRIATFRRWIAASGFEPVPLPSPSAQLSRAPIVMVAIATGRGTEEGFETLRGAVRRVIAHERSARLACVTVVRPTPALGGSTTAENSAQQRLDHLVVLRAWAEPLRLPPERVSMHVIESDDPVGALVNYARVNRVDHVVVGAPPASVPGPARASTVSMRVAADSPCTVTLARRS
jgi:nucleotide-binding universal stress UspA family protein